MTTGSSIQNVVACFFVHTKQFDKRLMREVLGDRRLMYLKQIVPMSKGL